METPVTVIGLGPMGQALAGAFLKAGHPTTVWNRTASKAEALVAQGAVSAPTVAEAVGASPLVIVCVLDYDASRELLEPVSDVLKGRTLINLTADTPERARAAAAWAAENGIEYLDGAIMSPFFTMGEPSAVIIYSGPEAVYRSHEQTLASLGGSQTHLGTEPGRAAAYDVALLDIFWTSMTGLVHAFALAKAENVKAEDLAPFAQGITALLPGMITDMAQEIDGGEYPGDGSNLASNLATFDHIIHAAEARGLDAGAIGAVRTAAQSAVEAGHGKDGISRLAETFRSVGRR